MKPILEIKEISKKFQIQSNNKPYLSLRENLFSFLKPSLKTEEFWALKDVSFNVEQGDTVGIIGRNGAGKSTLLKILSKITPPTSGKIISRGRIASLLEVGTGFHPELSGRENIFMNGSILGMRKAEILKNFDAIVEFAGVERFIDTPLKHYSSGMQLRLAFAVAAFLENEILVIDEVLAVGDAEFQKKCMNKMGDISKSGRTILFVSHNMASIKHLCKKGIFLNNGKAGNIDNINTIVTEYNSQYENDNTSHIDFKDSKKNEFVFIRSLTIKNENKINQNEFQAGTKFLIHADIEVRAKLNNTVVGIGFTSNEGAPIRTVWTKPASYEVGNYLFQFKEDAILYGAGIINLSIGVAVNEINLVHHKDCINLIFEENLDKEIALRSDCGFIINQMNYSVVKA